jgi:hypothetical protein
MDPQIDPQGYSSLLSAAVLQQQQQQLHGATDGFLEAMLRPQQK